MMTPSSVMTWMRWTRRLRLDHLPAADLEVQRQSPARRTRRRRTGRRIRWPRRGPWSRPGSSRGCASAPAIRRPRRAARPSCPRRAACGHHQGALDGRLVGDRSVELHDDGHGDADDLPIGQLELRVDLVVRDHGSEAAGERHRLAVAADRRTNPRVLDAIAQRFGGGEGRAVAVDGARHDLAFGVGQRDALQPPVVDLEPDGRGRRHVGGRRWRA